MYNLLLVGKEYVCIGTCFSIQHDVRWSNIHIQNDKNPRL